MGRQIAVWPDDLRCWGDYTRWIRVWDFTEPQEGPRFSNPPGLVRGVAFSNDGQRLAAIGRRLLKWDLSSGKLIASRLFEIAPLGAALSQDEELIAGISGVREHTLRILETTGKELFAESEKSMSSDLGFSPDGRLLAQGLGDGRVRVRDARTGRILQSLQGHDWANTNLRVAFSPDGSRLVSISAKPNVKIWDTATWREIASLNGHVAYALSLGFSQDSRWLATGGYDKSICVWDLAAGTKICDLAGQGDSVTSLVFTPDKKRLFSCGSEGSINVWDVPNRVKLLTLHQRGQYVTISPDGRRLATCTTDSATVQVWDSETVSREERTRRRQGRIPFWLPQWPTPETAR